METYQAVFKRKEVKYLLTEAQLAALRPALETHMELDAFAHSSISNLYYDTPDFRMVRRSLEKPGYKEKLRLRSYGLPGADSPVFPEIKKRPGASCTSAGCACLITRRCLTYPGSVPAERGRSSGRWIGCSIPIPPWPPESISATCGTPGGA